MTAEEVGKLLNVSRETLCQLEVYLELLRKWQRQINLVANSTMVDVWQRHILDSAQLVRFYPPNTKKILDVGSGAGFPGLVLAIMGDVEVDLVESDPVRGGLGRTYVCGMSVCVVHTRTRSHGRSGRVSLSRSLGTQPHRDPYPPQLSVEMCCMGMSAVLDDEGVSVWVVRVWIAATTQ